ncbi:H-N-H endonuclease [Salmonella phage SP-3]|uniref:H-N-H endonuclease n=1 Tax=Salmonella phage SP-3 TaxID=1186124 RepID=A0A2H4PIQ9_9CAUD|nr:membrane protein [Salmonella phage SP3]ATW62681.1 H-N-H endonuclease [Salmonella phage SP3]
MFSIIIAFIIGILAGVTREIAERERKFDEKRAEFEREWNDGSRSSRRRFKIDGKS